MRALVLTRKPLLNELSHWLGDASADTVVVTSQAATDHPERMFREVMRVADFGSSDIGKLLVDLARAHAVDRIGSLNEIDVLRAAVVREVLGLPGQSVSCALAFRDKHVMKSLAAASGVPVTPMSRVVGLDAARAAAARIGYPVVVKPVDGGGSVGVRVVPNDAAWTDMAAIRATTLLVEGYVEEADFYVVDGLMCDGVPTLHVALDMGQGNLAYAQGYEPVAGSSIPLTDPRHDELTIFTRQVLASLPQVHEETAFHLEIFRERSGRLLLCEIASRAGGMGHAPTFLTVTGTDLNGASLRGQLGLTRLPHGPARVAEGAFAGFPRRTGLLTRHPDRLIHPFVVDYRPSAHVGERYEKSGWVGDDAASVLVSARPGTDMRKVLDEVVAEYHSATTWVEDV